MLVKVILPNSFLYGIVSKPNPFENMDREYAQDAKHLDSIGDRAPTDEEWEECMRIWQRTWDRLYNLTLIEGGARSRN